MITGKLHSIFWIFCFSIFLGLAGAQSGRNMWKTMSILLFHVVSGEYFSDIHAHVMGMVQNSRPEHQKILRYFEL